MRIGVGLPNTIPGTPGRRLVEWAQRAEELGFSSLGTIGRLVFPTYDELQALTAAAAVTERIGLFSNLTIGPVYERALLAKQAAGLDQISGGRFVLGLATGWREEDYVVAGKSWAGRGRRLDADIEYMQRAWRGELVEGATKRLTPTPTNGESVPLAFGGTVPAAFERAARFGIGWTAAGASPDEVAGLFAAARSAWAATGRDGQPKLWALTYYVLGEGGRDAATAYLSDYYGDWGPGMAQGIPADAEGHAWRGRRLRGRRRGRAHPRSRELGPGPARRPGRGPRGAPRRLVHPRRAPITGAGASPGGSSAG